MQAAASSSDPSTLVLLQQAMQAHGAGQSEQARQTYLQVLQIEPDNADGLHLLGMLEGQFGSRDTAVALITRAIEVKPEEAMFHNNLGNVHFVANRLPEAERSYRRAVELDPARYDALNNLAVLLGRKGDKEGAERTFKALLEAAPGFTDARENLAELYLRQGRLSEALQQCALGLVTTPRAPGLRRLLGLAYSTWDMPEQAAQVYRDWIRDEPDNPQPAHYLAAFTGVDVPERASDDYVRTSFDNFADSFDSKLADLEYRAPELIGQALAEVLSADSKAWRVVDAGCGTGLCAAHLLPFARTLVGMDLSPAMLRLAVQRGGYDELHEAELVAFLQSRPAAFDVVVSADTLCYFGVLTAFAQAACDSLDDAGLDDTSFDGANTRSGAGWLIFTVEAHDDVPDAPDFRLQGHGRYSHRAGYVRQTLMDAGFCAPVLRSVVLRQEALKPVQGWLVSARLAARGTTT